MTLEIFFRLLKNNFKNIFLVGIFLAAASFVVLVFTQKNYRASTDLLLVQNQQATSDYYALSKSTDYLSGILMEAVYSEKFLEEIKNANLVSTNFLPTNEADRLKEWQRIVKLKKNANVGIITVDVYADSQKQGTEVSNAIVSVLTNKYSLFLGQGQNIEIRVLSGPIVEKNPSVIQILAVVFGGFIIGFILAFMFFYYKSEQAEKGSGFDIFGKNTFTRNFSGNDKKNDYFDEKGDYWKSKLAEKN